MQGNRATQWDLHSVTSSGFNGVLRVQMVIASLDQDVHWAALQFHMKLQTLLTVKPIWHFNRYNYRSDTKPLKSNRRLWLCNDVFQEDISITTLPRVFSQQWLRNFSDTMSSSIEIILTFSNRIHISKEWPERSDLSWCHTVIPVDFCESLTSIVNHHYNPSLVALIHHVVMEHANSRLPPTSSIAHTTHPV